MSKHKSVHLTHLRQRPRPSPETRLPGPPYIDIRFARGVDPTTSTSLQSINLRQCTNIWPEIRRAKELYASGAWTSPTKVYCEAHGERMSNESGYCRLRPEGKGWWHAPWSGHDERMYGGTRQAYIRGLHALRRAVEAPDGRHAAADAECNKTTRE